MDKNREITLTVGRLIGWGGGATLKDIVLNFVSGRRIEEVENRLGGDESMGNSKERENRRRKIDPFKVSHYSHSVTFHPGLRRHDEQEYVGGFYGIVWWQLGSIALLFLLGKMRTRIVSIVVGSFSIIAVVVIVKELRVIQRHKGSFKNRIKE